MSLIIVTDTHLESGGIQEQAFFEMLTRLGTSPHDVIFLGDIFELWIALPGYEGKPQQAFLQWCRQQKRSRSIGFLEGNHEFFVSAQHADCFSWSTSDSSWRDAEGNLFVHGDQINRDDNRYLMFRRLSKNTIARILLHYLPGGPYICHRLGQMLRHTNQQHRQGLPEEQIHLFADQHFASGVKTIFAGHFHSTFQYEHTSSQILYLLPAWFESGQVTLVEPGSEQVRVQSVHWESLPE